MACFHLPQTVDTFEGPLHVETQETMQALFDGVCAFRRKRGVTALVRRIVSANFENETTIHSTHETRTLAGTLQLQDAYLCFSVITQIDGTWKIASCHYAVGDTPEFNKILSGKDL